MLPNIPLAPADSLAKAIALPPISNISPVDLPEGSVCVLSGQPIRRGYRVMDVVTSANTEFLDQFAGQVEGYVSENAALCYRAGAPTTKSRVNGRMVANACAKSHLAIELQGGEVWYVSPAIDPNTAIKNNTLTWSEAVRYAWRDYAGHRAFIIMTPDFKRRLWPYARAGVLGEETPVYLLNKTYNLDGLQKVNWPELVETLNIVERFYNKGYSKDAIRNSLLQAPNTLTEKLGTEGLEPMLNEKPKASSPRMWG